MGKEGVKKFLFAFEPNIPLFQHSNVPIKLKL